MIKEIYVQKIWIYFFFLWWKFRIFCIICARCHKCLVISSLYASKVRYSGNTHSRYSRASRLRGGPPQRLLSHSSAKKSVNLDISRLSEWVSSPGPVLGNVPTLPADGRSCTMPCKAAVRTLLCARQPEKIQVISQLMPSCEQLSSPVVTLITRTHVKCAYLKVYDVKLSSRVFNNWYPLIYGELMKQFLK